MKSELFFKCLNKWKISNKSRYMKKQEKTQREFCSDSISHEDEDIKRNHLLWKMDVDFKGK